MVGDLLRATSEAYCYNTLLHLFPSKRSFLFPTSRELCIRLVFGSCAITFTGFYAILLARDQCLFVDICT